MTTRLIACVSLLAALMLSVPCQGRKGAEGSNKVEIKFVQPSGTDLGMTEKVRIIIEWQGGHDAKECLGGKLSYGFPAQQPEDFSIEVLGSASVEHPITRGLSGRVEQKIVLVYRPMRAEALTLKQFETLVTVRLASYNNYLRLNNSPPDNEMEKRYREVLKQTIIDAKDRLPRELNNRIGRLDRFEMGIDNVKLDDEDRIVVVDRKGDTKAVLTMVHSMPGLEKVSIDKEHRITTIDKKGSIMTCVIDLLDLKESSTQVWEDNRALKGRATFTLEDKRLMQPLKDDLVKWKKALEDMDGK